MLQWRRLSLVPLTIYSLLPKNNLLTTRAFLFSHFTRSRSTQRFQSDNYLEQDLKRWESMYQEDSTYNPMKIEDTPLRPLSSEVRVISFDLDNTLWNTGATISKANDVLADFLDGKQMQQPIRVETMMGELFQTDRSAYCPIDHEHAKAPVLLTQLRKDAIRRLLVDHNNITERDALNLADEAFQAWTTARHEAILENLATNVLQGLQELASLVTSQGHRVLIGAITDGNSDPRIIPEIGDFFDFCINAESVGVSKPDPRVYLKAARQVLGHESLRDLIGVDMIIDSMDDLELEKLIGPWWVHIGDDFAKDVVAAKTLGMRSIWARELILDRLLREQVDNSSSSNKRSVEDLMHDLSTGKGRSVYVGSSDYLLNSLQDEFADAVVDEFIDVGIVLASWHEEGTSLCDSEDKDTTIDSSAAPEMVRAAKDTSGETLPSTKFCIECGDKIPRPAKFCSSCGEKQPVV